MNEEKVVKNKIKCRLCKQDFFDEEMSEEHYPAKSVGNDDVVAFDIMKYIDMLSDKKVYEKVSGEIKTGKSIEEIFDDIFDNELSRSLYPKGRTTRTLCKTCNTFLGKYDEDYLKFFNCDGSVEVVRGYQQKTKYNIIKAIFAKFLSIPETQNIKFDFIDFIRNPNSTKYEGKWKIYFIKRDFSTDLFNFRDISTGKIEFEEGVVYELSDDRFIYNLMNFEKHECYPMTDIFEILNKNYTIIEGCGELGGYHGQIMMMRTFTKLK